MNPPTPESLILRTLASPNLDDRVRAAAVDFLSGARETSWVDYWSDIARNASDDFNEYVVDMLRRFVVYTDQTLLGFYKNDFSQFLMEHGL